MHVNDIGRLVLSIAVFSSQNRSAEPKAEGENDDEDDDDNKKSRVASSSASKALRNFALLTAKF
jgi:hypothetical protein